MQNPQPQLLLLFRQAYILSKISGICLLLGTSRYLLILFTELNSLHSKKEEEDKVGEDAEGKISTALNEMKSVYHMLMACLYCVYIASAATLPLQLLHQLQLSLVLLGSLLLVCSCGEIVPRIILDRHHQPRCLAKWTWVIGLVKILNKILPLNSLLRRIFQQQSNREENHAFLTKQNVHRQLNLISTAVEEKPIRQEELQLLEKLRQLSSLDVKALIIPKKNVFLLDINAVLTTKLLIHLGKYYFSKILIYEKYQDNIVGYLQFKQLLSFQIDQKISTHSSVICRNIVIIHEDSNLSTAIEQMIVSKINFAIVYSKNRQNFIGLVKLKDIFSRLLLKWYNYAGLTADRSFHSISSMMSLTRDARGVLEEAEQQI